MTLPLLEKRQYGTAHPAGFNPAPQEIEHVEMSYDAPDFIRPTAYSAVQKEGLKYQRAVTQHLQDHYAKKYKIYPEVWLKVTSPNGDTRHCQPDIFMLNDDYLVILEAKLTHKELAWWQLNSLYRPVLSAYLKQNNQDRRIILCEVTRWYDAMVRTPSRPEVIRDLQGIQPGPFYVWVHKDGRRR